MTNTELKSIRKALDLSKTDFARAIGISPVMEGKYEKGSREIPDAVSQAAYELLNTAEQEPDPVVDEGDVFEDGEEAASVTEETAEPAVEDVTSPAADEASADEVISAEDADQAAVDVSASATEETAAVAEKAPAEEEKSTAAANTPCAKDDADTANWAAAALPFFLPPFLMTQFLFNIGFMMSSKKKGFFGPWW